MMLLLFDFWSEPSTMSKEIAQVELHAKEKETKHKCVNECRILFSRWLFAAACEELSMFGVSYFF